MPEETQHPNERTAVRNLQTYLRQLAYHDPRIPLVPLDGIYAETTQAAVEAFQRIHHLPVTGITDRPTWDLLFAEYQRSLDEHNPPEAITPFPRVPPGYEIIQGEESDLVGILHAMLRTLTQYYDEFGPLPDGQIYTNATERAVRDFQSRHALPQSGRVDIHTWNRLAREYNRIVGDNQ